MFRLEKWKYAIDGLRLLASALDRHCGGRLCRSGLWGCGERRGRRRHLGVFEGYFSILSGIGPLGW